MKSQRSLRRLRLLGWVTALSAIVGALLANLQSGQPNAASTVFGAVDGLLVGSALCVYQLFLYDGGRSGLFRRLNFASTVVFNAAAYTVLIFLMRTLGRILTGRFLTGASTAQEGLVDPYLGVTLLSVLGLSVVVNLVFQVSELIGPGELRRFVTGRYHRPRLEQRAFLFLDLASSTAIAEDIGPELFHRLLDSFFRDMTETILRTRGEIYKYVGDEVIVSWPMERVSSDCLDFAFQFRADLEVRREFYEETFGLLPRFRAALHCGEVVSGEMGLIRKEIAYLGDVLNTTARILSVGRKLGIDVLCSEDVIALVGGRGHGRTRPIGRVRLRGRVQPIGLFAVDAGSAL